MMSRMEERLTKNRKRACIRRERKRDRVNVMKRNVYGLQSRNDDLRQKNKKLIQHLARYGITWGGRTASTTMTNHTKNIPNGLSLTALPIMRSNIRLHDTVTPFYRDDTRLKADIGHNTYSQALQIAVTPPIWNSSFRDGKSSNDGPLQQAMRCNLEQEHQRIQEEAAIIAETRMRADVDHNLYHQAIHDTALPLLWPNSLHDQKLSINGSLQRALKYDLERNQQRILEKIALTSMQLKLARLHA